MTLFDWELFWNVHEVMRLINSNYMCCANMTEKYYLDSVMDRLLNDFLSEQITINH